MIYIHVPFCRSFCTYCDFYSEIAPEKECKGFEAFADAVLREVSTRKEELGSPTSVNTLYIGGGTPSVLPLDVLGRIVERVRTASGKKDFAEFTIEVNPEDIVEKGEEYVRELASLGVNRVSMGIQSLDDGILKWMNRRHDSSRAIDAFRLLRSGGLGNISVDLIFGLTQLSDGTWRKTIEEVLALDPEHISAYQLSIEGDSTLGRMVASGKYQEADEEICRRQYDILCSRLKAAGYRHYEISNFAKPGFEAVHNSAYWRRVPYVGLGPGAHSLSSGNIRSWNSQKLRYSREEEVLSPENIRIERIMLPLRTDIGLPAEELYSLSDPSVIHRLLSDGALEFSPSAPAGHGEVHPRFAAAEYRLSPQGPPAIMQEAPDNVMLSGAKHLRIPEDHFFTSDEIIRELI